MTKTPRPLPRRSVRQLSEDDRRVWNAVVRSIKPLRRRAPAPDLADAVPNTKPAKAHAAPKSTPNAPAGETRRASLPGPASPALAPLPRRERQRIARGGLALEARIDLHGLTQSEAHGALVRFLRRAQADGVKFALVITGKGGLAERGVLRRQVPLWLRLPEFRSYVVGFDDAHSAHGGRGAFYVRIRRPRNASDTRS